jgi:hypothetical protein
MRRICLIVGVAATAVIAARLDAQSPPDLSGKWVLASSQPPGTYALGREFSVAQDAATLRIDSTGISFSASTASGWSETPFRIQTIHVLDGIEHPAQVIADPPVAAVSAPTSGMRMSSTTEESLSKATWAGRQLVIMTYSRIRTTAPSRTPAVSVMRQTVRQSLSLETDGTLVVESLIVADPLPWALEAPSPAPVRSTYKKG